MRMWIAVMVLLAGCSTASDPAAQDAMDDEGVGTAAPITQPLVNETPPPPVSYYNGTIQHVGHCAVLNPELIGGITWHQLDNKSGLDYATEFDAVAGPPPAVIGATGACLLFDTPAGMEQMAPRGTVPDDATRVVALTDAMVDGTYSIRIG